MTPIAKRLNMRLMFELTLFCDIQKEMADVKCFVCLEVKQIKYTMTLSVLFRQ